MSYLTKLERGSRRSVVSESFVLSVLRRLARQSVAVVLKPENVLVIQNALMVDDNRTEAALRTCEMRGWITQLHDAVPSGRLSDAGELPMGWERTEAIYRLTEAGWNAIHGTYQTTLWVLRIAVATLLVTLFSIAVTLATAYPHLLRPLLTGGSAE